MPVQMCLVILVDLKQLGLVIAGIADLQRPADKISVSQCGALLATGVIWSRYSLVIIPKNYSLFSVNVFVALTQCYQMYRAIRKLHRMPVLFHQKLTSIPIDIKSPKVVEKKILNAEQNPGQRLQCLTVSEARASGNVDTTRNLSFERAKR
ncbi:unnamed protein product [Callosobruchus maculatus]|uniref:Mitochondrial pyruvate carrier n=1 Tax=Callosobruchus maculatus TaxID=64391 RepID=A0A653BIG9_CALMS|nr:unnamed protein product [Callosobruchus maculatus]